MNEDKNDYKKLCLRWNVGTNIKMMTMYPDVVWAVKKNFRKIEMGNRKEGKAIRKSVHIKSKCPFLTAEKSYQRETNMADDNTKPKEIA